MNVPRSTAAEVTAAILQRAANGGVPVMIPGAWERRVGRPTVLRPTGVTVESITSHTRTVTDGDRELAAPQRTFFARLWHWVAHPSH